MSAACPACDGRGWILQYVPVFHPMANRYEEEAEQDMCGECWGDGRLWSCCGAPLSVSECPNDGTEHEEASDV